MDATAAALLERIRDARTRGVSLTGGAGGGLDLDSAYRIQAALGEGREPKGYKLARFGGGAGTPAHGRVYADMLLTGPVSLGTFLRPRLALRLAAVLASDLAPGATPGATDLALGGLFVAVELTDSVWSRDPGTVAAAVADNASAGAFVVGERLLPLPPRGFVTLAREGERVAEHDLARDEDAADRLLWLAGEVGGLQQGQIVLLEPRPGHEPVAAAVGAYTLSGPDGSFLAFEIRP